MKNPRLIKFLFTDKESTVFWTSYFVITLIISWPLFLIGIICYLGIYTSSFYYFNKYFQLKKYLEGKNIQFIENSTKIKLFQKGYKTGGPLYSRQFFIAIKPKESTINYIKTQKGSCFFPYKRELGLIKIYQKPFVIIKDSNTYPDFFYLQDRICKNNIVKDNDKIVINCKDLYKDIEIFEIFDNVIFTT